MLAFHFSGAAFIVDFSLSCKFLRQSSPFHQYPQSLQALWPELH
ncbi:hypothetical protein SPWS13_0595 [Shewanella putrefaciens]|nr:hypothetical protein SPWS13_0595 [Shewanella putrefaciens]